MIESLPEDYEIHIYGCPKLSHRFHVVLMKLDDELLNVKAMTIGEGLRGIEAFLKEQQQGEVVKGVLTSCTTGEESEVSLEYIIKPSASDSSRKIFALLNGVTGYESFHIGERAIDNMPVHGWLACAGTEGKWDKLFIPAEEMRKAFMEAGLLRRYH